MKEYKVTIKTWYIGGFWPDLFGKTHPTVYETAKSAESLYKKYSEMIESIAGGDVKYDIDIKEV